MPRFDTFDGPIEVSRRWVASDVGRLRQRWLAASRRMRDRRKRRAESGEKAKWYDLLDFFPPLEDLSVATVIVIVLTAILLVWFVAVPLLIPLIGLLGQLAWLLLLIPIVFSWKVLARRPWLVDATAADGTLVSWRITGWIASGRLEREVMDMGSQGFPIGSIRTDLQINQV